MLLLGWLDPGMMSVIEELFSALSGNPLILQVNWEMHPSNTKV